MQDKDLPPWAEAIGSYLAEELIETHMWMPPEIRSACDRLARSEIYGARTHRVIHHPGGVRKRHSHVMTAGR